MSVDQICIFALIQGLTEFFPVSSSAHLIWIPHLLKWGDPGVFMPVAVHFGTLGAIVVYFWQDVRLMASGARDLLKGHFSPGARLLVTLSLATLPALVTGVWVDRLMADSLKTLPIIAYATLGGAALLYLADRLSRNIHTRAHISFSESFWGWGMAQALAFIPGMSRSGMCITLGRFLGYQRKESAHFAFLMAIPVMLAATLFKGVQLVQDKAFDMLPQACLGAGIAFLTGLGALSLFMYWLKNLSLMPFILYRVVLGAGLLYSAYF